MAQSSKAPYLFAFALLVAVICIYIPGLQNGLLFDDQRFKDGSIFGVYGNLLDFKQRMLSYGSFVWVQQVVGEGWWKQRIFNLGLHLAVVASIYALFKSLLGRTEFPQDIQEQEHFQSSRQAALLVGLIIFALNPVAVYAVNYLIQRSILMATLFSVLSCWAFVRALDTQRLGWFMAAAISYALAVLSKEHAIMTAALMVPLYVYVKQPHWKTALTIGAVAAVLLAIATTVFLQIYGNVLGRAFDPQSVAFAQQLEALKPGVTSQLYPLSILNEAALFFVYGLLWVLPYVGWMSIDLRPAFPLGLASSWHVLGALGYCALLFGSAWVVVRHSGVLRLAALCLLFPLLWFVTEFSTVWIQDPLVLYRSYLWAVPLPALLAIVLTGFKPRTIYIVGALLGLTLAALALERNLSMVDENTAWADAAEKIDRQAPANAVGRSRPFLNLGAYHLGKGLLDQAERDLTIAAAFGDRGQLGGSVRFNLGVVQQQRNKHAQALQSFETAEALGYKALALDYHRGESQAALGQTEQAYQSISKALNAAINDPQQKATIPNLRLRRAELALATDHYDVAAKDYDQLLRENPRNIRFAQGLGIALVKNGQGALAAQIFDELIALAPSASAYYGRAMIHQNTGRPAAALKDLDQAIQLDPGNQQYRRLREQLGAKR